MLPILNLRNKEATLHASEALTLDNIAMQNSLYAGGLKTNAEQQAFENEGRGLNGEDLLKFDK